VTTNSSKSIPKFTVFYLKIMGIFFNLLYHSFAWTYDWVAETVSVGQWNEWVLSAIPYLDGPRILELGFGPGHLQKALRHSTLLQAALNEGKTSDRGLKVFGIDESVQMVRQTVSRLASSSGYAKLTCLCRARAQALPYPAASFDNVVSTFPSPYILDPATLAEIFRILPPGGKLVIVLSAEITSQKSLHRAAALLFKLTGQTYSDESPFIKRINAAGFSARSFRHILDYSEVLLIEATR
jgi:ubiquinone/menaquinone biosynthesis C-methylase UbiE